MSAAALEPSARRAPSAPRFFQRRALPLQLRTRSKDASISSPAMCSQSQALPPLPHEAACRRF